VDSWHDQGQAGFRVWRYRLVNLSASLPSGSVAEPDQEGIAGTAKRRESTVLRIVRDTKQAIEIKKLYNHQCQVCGVRLEGPGGPYAEAAHVQPLGEPHRGPDSKDNILCLCPNHHVLFDLGAFTIADDLSLIGTPGSLRLYGSHHLNNDYLRYRRDHYNA